MAWQDDIEENIKCGLVEILILALLTTEDMCGYISYSGELCGKRSETSPPCGSLPPCGIPTSSTLSARQGFGLNKHESTDNHSFPVLSNRIPSSGYFPFPAHREPGQGSGNRRSAVLAEAYAFCEENRLPTAFIACRIECAVSDSPTQYSPVFNASADTDCCSLPRFFGDGVLFAANRRR